MNDLRKLIHAGGVTAVLTTLLVGGAYLYAPNLLWLAVLTSLAIGYLAYEFGEVLKAVPTAFTMAWTGLGHVGNELAGIWTEISGEVKTWWRKGAHPFFLVGVFLMSVLMALSFYADLFVIHRGIPPQFNSSFTYTLAVVPVGAIFGAVGMLISFLLACAGSQLSEKVFWTWGEGLESQTRKQDMEKVGLKEASLTYANGFRWMLKGVWVLFYFVFWGVWAFCFKVIWNVIRFVHSSKRLMVMADGPLGGLTAMVTYYYLGPLGAGAYDYLLVLVSSYVIGSTLILVNYEWVARRVFRVEPA